MSETSVLQGLSKQPLTHVIHLSAHFARSLVQKENTDTLQGSVSHEDV